MVKIMLTIEFVPYSEIENLSSEEKIKKILSIVKKKNIALIQGRLSKEEETKLIEETMKNINENFSGIELAVIYPQVKKTSFFKYVKEKFINLILSDRQGLTIVGPATIIKEIKRDPNRIMLYTKENKRKGKK